MKDKYLVAEVLEATSCWLSSFCRDVQPGTGTRTSNAKRETHITHDPPILSLHRL